MPTLHVVIPFYNEAETLEPCIRRVLAARLPGGFTPRLVVIDDCSGEAGRAAAAALIETLESEGVSAQLCRHAINKGKGAALQTGFDAVLASKPADDDLVVIQDADLEYDPADYEHLMRPLTEKRADVVVGTRWGDHRELKGLKRRIHAGGNGLLSATSNLMTGYRLHDMECCYKLFPVRVLRAMRSSMTEPRFGVEPQMIATFSRLGARIDEVSISYDPRSLADGKKIGWTDGVRALYVILRERFRPAPPEKLNAKRPSVSSG